MPLINIEQGDKVLSTPLNNNFNYLNGRVTETNVALTSAVSSMSSSISSAVSSLNTKIDNAVSEVMPIGTIVFYSGSTVPDGWLICDGSNVKRSGDDGFADLFAKIGTTYGAGDGSTTFGLPNLLNKFVEGSLTVGTNVPAGLPNIWGRFQSIYSNYNGGTMYTEGAFTGGYRAGAGMGHSGDKHWDFSWVDLNASRSSSIYGASSTVQPPALTMLPIIKY